MSDHARSLGSRASTPGVNATIIVPTRNRSRALIGCLSSLVKQTVSPGEFEILIIDNASTDHTPATSALFIQLHRDHRIRYIPEPVPGLLSGRHRGAVEASADLLCFVDDDIIADPSWLEFVLKAFSDPNVHLVGGPSIARFEKPAPFWIEHFSVEIPEGRYLDSLSLIDLGPFVRAIAPNLVFGLNFSIRKQTLFELGGFHPDGVPTPLVRYRGDGETGLASKILETGYKSLYHPGARVEHIICADRLQLDYLKNRRFLQGVSDSYTQIRRIGATKDIPSRELPEPIQPREMEDIREYSIRMLRYETEIAYAKGFNFHLAEARSDPELLAWILRPNYIEDYNYRYHSNEQ
jgi:glycosyltransferase involved in cell wall biosynthesis